MLAQYVKKPNNLLCTEPVVKPNDKQCNDVIAYGRNVKSYKCSTVADCLTFSGSSWEAEVIDVDEEGDCEHLVIVTVLFL